MKKVILCIVAILLTVSSYGELKYVFYMIGDGMGANQVLAAEMYQAELQGRIGRVPLTMTSFPVFGMVVIGVGNRCAVGDTVPLAVIELSLGKIGVDCLGFLRGQLDIHAAQ